MYFFVQGQITIQTPQIVSLTPICVSALFKAALVQLLALKNESLYLLTFQFSPDGALPGHTFVQKRHSPHFDSFC